LYNVVARELGVEEKEGVGERGGGVGTRLEANVHIVTSSTTAAQNIVTAVNRSGLFASDTVLEPIAVGEAILTEDEKELGSVLVDIGGGETDIAIYHHRAVRHTVRIPLGGTTPANRHP